MEKVCASAGSQTGDVFIGTEGENDQILKLSDAFIQNGNPAQADIEARVRMVNINYGKNESLPASCRLLEEYAWLVRKIRENQRTMQMIREKGREQGMMELLTNQVGTGDISIEKRCSMQGWHRSSSWNTEGNVKRITRITTGGNVMFVGAEHKCMKC